MSKMQRQKGAAGEREAALLVWVLAGTYAQANYHAASAGLRIGEWRYLADRIVGVRRPLVWCIRTYYERDGIHDLMADLRAHGAQGWDPKTGVYGPL